MISEDEGDQTDRTSKEASARILGGMQHMTSGLQHLSEEAEKEHQEEEARQAKRPRQEKSAQDEAMGALAGQPSVCGSKALQPFAVPGQR